MAGMNSALGKGEGKGGLPFRTKNPERGFLSCRGGEGNMLSSQKRLTITREKRERGSPTSSAGGLHYPKRWGTLTQRDRNIDVSKKKKKEEGP